MSSKTKQEELGSNLDSPVKVRAFGRVWTLTANDIYADFTRESLKDTGLNYVRSAPVKHTSKTGMYTTIDQYYPDIVSSVDEVSVPTSEDMAEADPSFLSSLIADPKLWIDMVSTAWQVREYNELKELYTQAVLKNPQWYEISIIVDEDAQTDPELQADLKTLNVAIEHGGEAGGDGFVETPEGELVEIGDLGAAAERVSAKETKLAKKKTKSAALK